MDPDDARRLMGEIEPNYDKYSEAEQVAGGITIILSYMDNPIGEIAAEHDVIYCGDFYETVEKMTPEIVEDLAHRGWFCWDEESWAHRV